MGSDSISLIIIVACIVMSAYFSATETAFSSLNRIRVKNLAEKGNKKAKLVMKLSENYDSLLSTILIGNNIVNIASASLATVLFVNMLGAEAGPSVSTAVTTVVVLIFGEVSPKSIAKLLSLLLNLLMTQGLQKFIVDEAEQDGGIDEQESKLIHSALEFTEQEVIDVLTPRIDITAVSTQATKEEIAEIFAETAYSRIPLYDESVDHIIGIIYQKDFHNYVYHTDKDISEIVRPTLYVHKNKKIGVLLKELQQRKMHFAVVLDEFGGTIGIVTLEDILEELVGEIWDEHDEVNSEIEIKSEDEVIALGSANVEKLFEVLNIEITEDEEIPVIVNGWVMKELERIPVKGDTFEYKGYKITVLSVNEKRVEKVLIKKN